jgi:hypothetical protein
MKLKWLYLIVLFIVLQQSLSASGNTDRTEDINIYNQALNLYNEKNYEKADELLGTIGNLKNKSNSEKMMMLSANNAYRLGDKLIGESQDLEKAGQLIEKSAAWYERVLQLNEENSIAAHNLELVHKLKEKLKQAELQQQMEQQKKDELQNQLKDIQQKQEQLASDSQKGADDHKTDQEDLQKETKDLSEQLSDMNEAAQKQLEEASDFQKQALEDLKENNYNKAEDLQKSASESLKKAMDAMNGDNSEAEKGSEQQEEKTADETDLTAQKIIENENNRETSSDQTGEGNIVNRNW